ncbi:MAG: sulfotransferase [Alphaproteobacteria bacterium]
MKKLLTRALFPTRDGALVAGNRLRELHALAVAYPLASVDYALSRARFSRIRNFLLFIGYPRSGHSLVGTLLNAHPDALIAHEMNALPYFMLGFRRPQILALLRRRDDWFEGINRQWSGYDYRVPGASKGQYKTPTVIGDNRAGGTTWHLRDDPDLLNTIRRRMNMGLRIVFNIRNPYDNIATIARQEGRSTANAISRYRDMTEIICQATRALPADELHLQWHEDLVKDPAAQLETLCTFAGLEADQDYLDRSASIVYPAARRTRQDHNWSDSDVNAVEDLCREFDFLKRYQGSFGGP